MSWTSGAHDHNPGYYLLLLPCLQFFHRSSAPSRWKSTTFTSESSHTPSSPIAHHVSWPGTNQSKATGVTYVPKEANKLGTSAFLHPSLIIVVSGHLFHVSPNKHAVWGPPWPARSVTRLIWHCNFLDELAKIHCVLSRCRGYDFSFAKHWIAEGESLVAACWVEALLWITVGKNVCSIERSKDCSKVGGVDGEGRTGRDTQVNGCAMDWS